MERRSSPVGAGFIRGGSMSRHESVNALSRRHLTMSASVIGTGSVSSSIRTP
jgi:hypothetical protein